jgi:hypothetical protein
MVYCRARFAARVAPAPRWAAIRHDLTHFRLTIYPQPCVVHGWPQRTAPGLLWLPLADVAGAALPAPIKKLLKATARHLTRFGGAGPAQLRDPSSRRQRRCAP